MKTKHILLFTLISLLGVSVASCNKTSSSEELSSLSSSEETSVSTISADPSQGDANWVDYVNNGSVSLSLEYSGKDFYVDGIGQFELKTCIDGDTAHFTPMIDSTGQGTMKARFYGIDTPESTGKVQEYGKEASYFTKGILEEAAKNGTIVVSSAQDTYGAPNPDSTGQRYVSLVWVNLTKKNAPKEELSLLNLWIVQEGLSWVKNVNDMPQYVDTFYAAEQQAKDYKLNLFSGKKAGFFNYGDYEDVSLLEIKYEIAAHLNNNSHANIYDNKKVRISGTVAGFSNHILYLQDYVLYDNDNPSLGGEYCGINIFVGMTDISSKYTTLNTYIQLCGLCQDSELFGFQITDTQGRFPVGSATSENDAKIIYKPAQNVETEHNLYQFEFTPSELSTVASKTNPFDLGNLNCYTKVTEPLVCNRCYISDDYEITLNFKNVSFNCYVPFIYKGDSSRPGYRWVLESDFIGQKFSLQGVYVYHITQSGRIGFQIVPNGASDLVWLGAE